MFITEQKAWQTPGRLDGQRWAWPSTCVDPEYDDPEYRQANFGHIQEIVETFFLLQTADEIYHEGQARGLAIGALNAPDDLLDDEHLLARRLLRSGRP